MSDGFDPLEIPPMRQVAWLRNFVLMSIFRPKSRSVRRGRPLAAPQTLFVAPPSGRQPRPTTLFLLNSQLAKSTQKSYSKSVKVLRDYLTEQKLPLPEQTDRYNSEELDWNIADWMGALYDARGGVGRQTAVNAVFGLLNADPNLRLPVSRRAIKGWSKNCPPTPWPPFSLEVMSAVAFELALAGHWRAAAQTVVAFHSLLRISEMAALRVGDIGLPGDRHMGNSTLLTGALIRLLTTKTGREQSVTLTDESAIAMLRLCTAGGLPDSIVFHPAPQYRKLLAGACNALRLRERYVPHSLRHGGATYLFMRGVEVARIQQHGRWRAQESCFHYVQVGRNLMLAARTDPRIVSIGRRLFPLIGTLITLSQRLVVPPKLPRARTAARRVTASRGRGSGRGSSRPIASRGGTAARSGRPPLRGSTATAAGRVPEQH